MKLPVYNLVIRVHKYDDDARGDADDARLHTNSDDEGIDTIIHKHNDDDDGNFYDNDDDDKEKDDSNDDNHAENGNGGPVNDNDDTDKFRNNYGIFIIYVVHETILISMVSATALENSRECYDFRGSLFVTETILIPMVSVKIRS